MSEELRAREVLARTKREAPANLQFDPDAIAVCAMLSFASSAAGQREGLEKARDALEVVAGGDLDVSGTAIIVGNGAATVMRQVRDALEAIASPSAPEERRDESGISDADLDAAARHGFGDTIADELLAEEHRNGVERLREAALVNLRGHAHDVIEQYGRNKVAVALARSVLAATDKGSN